MRVNFSGAGLFSGLCGFVLSAPSQQHTRHSGQSEPESASWKEGPIKEQPNNNQPNCIQRDNINVTKGVSRASSSGDQGVFATETHKSPIMEIYETKTGCQSRSI